MRCHERALGKEPTKGKVFELVLLDTHPIRPIVTAHRNFRHILRKFPRESGLEVPDTMKWRSIATRHAANLDGYSSSLAHREFLVLFRSTAEVVRER